MKPVEFPGMNLVLGPPEDITDEECDELPVATDGEQCVSCWEMTEEEKAQVLITGRIWLGVYSGRTQPPVVLSTAPPMIVESEANRGDGTSGDGDDRESQGGGLSLT